MFTNFINATAMHLLHPDIFEIPPAEVMNRIKPGVFVKVGVNFDPPHVSGNTKCNSERFWVKVTGVQNDKIVGTVGNMLVFDDEHGFDYGKEIAFNKQHVLDVMFAYPEEHP